MATTNPWKNFQGLLPKTNRIIGTVDTHNSNGSSTIILRSGLTMTAKGQGVSTGKKALIESGEVVREVPDLPHYDAQV